MSSYQAAASRLVAANATQPGAAQVDGTYWKVFRRIVSFLMLCYVVAALDRVNLDVATLQMRHDLAFVETLFGCGAGVLFTGYFLFGLPGNVLMPTIGARR